MIFLLFLICYKAAHREKLDPATITFSCFMFMKTTCHYFDQYSNSKRIFSLSSSSYCRLTKQQILLCGSIVYLHLGWLFNLQRWQLWVEQLCGESAFIQLHPFPLSPICKLSWEVSLGTYGLSQAHLSVFVWPTAGNHTLIGCPGEQCKWWTTVHTSNLQGVWQCRTETLKIMTTAICIRG